MQFPGLRCPHGDSGSVLCDNVARRLQEDLAGKDLQVFSLSFAPHDALRVDEEIVPLGDRGLRPVVMSHAVLVDGLHVWKVAEQRIGQLQ
jgi:hypothetical protein